MKPKLSKFRRRKDQDDAVYVEHFVCGNGRVAVMPGQTVPVPTESVPLIIPVPRKTPEAVNVVVPDAVPLMK